MENNDCSTLEIILDYSGEKIKDHTMDVREFTKSLNGFYDLLKLVANKSGFKDEEIKIEIKNVDEGCLKTIIEFLLANKEVIGVVANSCAIATCAVSVIRNVIKVIKTKKQISNKRDIAKFKVANNLANIELLNDINTYKYINNFTSCLDVEVENIDIETNDKDIEKLNINRSERPNLSYIPEVKNNSEELKEKDIILYLDGIQGSTEKWHFFKKDKDGGKKTKLTAEVLSPKLLEFGKDTSYKDYSNIPLYCKVIIKTFLKDGNKNKTTEYHIVDCNFESNNGLFE